MSSIQHTAKVAVVLLLFLLFGRANAQNCEWLSVAGSPAPEHAKAITTDKNNDVIVVGSHHDSVTIGGFFLPKSGVYAGLIIKYNTQEQLKWAITTNVTFASGYCSYVETITDKERNIYVSGYMMGTVNFGNGVSYTNTASIPDFILVKYDTNGMALWARGISGVSGGGGRLSVDRNNNILLGFYSSGIVSFQGSGSTLVSNGGYDIIIAKYNQHGSLIRVKNFGGIRDDIFNDLGTDGNDNIYVLGKSVGNLVFGAQLLRDTGEVILKMDSAFTPLKGRKTFYNDYHSSISYAANLSGIAVLENGYFAITGLIYDSVNIGNGIYLTSPWSYTGINSKRLTRIIYYDFNLDPVWARKSDTISANVYISPTAGILESNDYLYIGGLLGWGSVRFGSSSLNFAGGVSDIQLFILKMDLRGNFLWAFTSDEVNSDSRMNGMYADNNGDVLITGTFQSKVKVFNQSRLGHNGTNQYDIFTAKISDYTITRGFVSSGPYCAGDSISIPFTKKGIFNPGNEFIAQLSDSAGNFETGYRELGRLTDTSGGVVKGVLPLFDVATNNRYRIRIISTNPVVQSFYRVDTLRLLIYSKDTANAGKDTVLCKGQSLQLSTTGGSKWAWSPKIFLTFPADTSNRRITVKPDSTTEYRVIISDSSGCGLTDTDYVVVHIRPQLKISVPDTIRFCKGRTVKVTAIASGGNSARYTFRWSYKSSPSSWFSQNREINVSPADITTYQVLLADSCSLPVTAWVTLVPDSTFDLPSFPDTTICLGNAVHLDASALACDPASAKYWWDNGLGDGAAKTVAPSVTTVYKVTGKDTVNGITDSALIKVIVRSPLDVRANSDTTICHGQTINLKAVIQGGQTSNHKILWTVDNGPWSDSNFTVTVSPGVTTTYTAVLTDNCTVNPDTARVTVTVRPPLQVTLNPDTIICIGETAELRAGLQGGDTLNHTLKWKADNSSWTANQTKETVSPGITTVYTAVLTDNCTVRRDSAKITVTVRPPLEVTVNADTTICTGQTAILKATLEGGYSTQYKIRWTSDSGPWTDTNTIVLVDPATTTTYKAILTDACTTPSDSSQITVTVRPPLQVSAMVKDSICANQVLLLTANASGGDPAGHAFLWRAEGGSWSSPANPATDTPKVNTTYVIRLGDNCSPNVFDTVKVTVLPVPKADFSITPLEGCPPLVVTFTDLSTGHDTLQNTWKMETSETKGITQYSHLFANPGKYNVGLNISNSLGCTDYVLKTNAVTVFDKPRASFTVKPDIKEIESPVYLYNESRDASQYTWDMGDGNYLYPGNKNDILYRYTDTGNLVIRLIAQNGQGCLDTSSQLIRVFDKIHCVIPTGFTPNGDGLNSLFGPVCTGAAEYHMTIYNRWGQVIYDCENCLWDGYYAGEPVLPGVYMYKLNITGENRRKATTFGTIQVIR